MIFADFIVHLKNGCEIGKFFEKKLEKYAIQVYIYKIFSEMKWRG